MRTFGITILNILVITIQKHNTQHTLSITLQTQKNDTQHNKK
jgi:hypothetical protein